MKNEPHSTEDTIVWG